MMPSKRAPHCYLFAQSTSLRIVEAYCKFNEQPMSSLRPSRGAALLCAELTSDMLLSDSLACSIDNTAQNRSHSSLSAIRRNRIRKISAVQLLILYILVFDCPPLCSASSETCAPLASCNLPTPRSRPLVATGMCDISDRNKVSPCHFSYAPELFFKTQLKAARIFFVTFSRMFCSSVVSTGKQLAAEAVLAPATMIWTALGGAGCPQRSMRMTGVGCVRRPLESFSG
jgi:hypothetical protein